ncbi:MAG: thioredoxin [Phycisphaerae bacterium]|nr:thioredoxin [Phycisphaerae bacterium]
MAGVNTQTFTDVNFDEEVLKSETPVLVDFGAEWCAPCKALGPVIDELGDEYAGKIKVGKVDTDANREVSARYQVSALPTVLLFKDGEIKEKFVGLRGKQDFQTILNTLCTG